MIYFPDHFFLILFCTLKYVNMIRIGNISFFRFDEKNQKLDWPKCARTVGSVHTSANLIFDFSNKNGKRKYYLSLSYLHILEYRIKKKKKMVRKIDHFFHFSNFDVKFKNTKKYCLRLKTILLLYYFFCYC